jgi:hypothetical protein
MEFGGSEIRVRGRLIRTAFVEGEGYQFLDKPEATIEFLAKSRERVDLFTFIQKLSDTTPNHSYRLEWDNMAALPISTYDNWITNQIDRKVRNKVRKAAKSGVEVREIPFDDALLKGIQGVYNESPIRQGRRFPHYGEDLETLRKIKGTFLERSIFIGAFFEGELIGFVKIVSDQNQGQAGLMHILSMIKHRDKASTNALVAQAVRSCAERQIPYLWYANMTYRSKQESELAAFKRHNGFQKIDVPRYYVPLTAAGKMALRLGLHRGLVNWIPEPVADSYRRVRGFWYAKTSPAERAPSEG